MPSCFKLNSMQIQSITCTVVYILLIIYAMATGWILEIFIALSLDWSNSHS